MKTHGGVFELGSRLTFVPPDDAFQAWNVFVLYRYDVTCFKLPFWTSLGPSWHILFFLIEKEMGMNRLFQFGVLTAVLLAMLLSLIHI